MASRLGTPNKHPGRWTPAKEHERIGFFLTACLNMSEDGYTLCIYSKTHKEWRVHVRHGGQEHTATSHEALLIAVGRAVEWLQQRRQERDRGC